MCEIAKKIYDRRKELGLTLEDVGKAVGVGRSTVQRWEKGMIKNMGRDKIAALAKILKMNPVELVPMPKVDLQLFASSKVNDEDQEVLEALHQDPRLRMLFDRSRKMSDEDKEKMLQIANVILGELGRE